MSNYFWRDFADAPPAERFPDWVEGVHLWREFIGGDAFAHQQLLDALVSARARVVWGQPDTELSRPRLFISHRKDDDDRARDVSALAQAEGFQVWLDVLDSGLQRAARASTGTPPDTQAIAEFIEMALLNCTHVIALITPRTPGTYWVPYEYGRAKDSSLHSLQAACWIDHDVTYEPEYLELGVKTRSDAEIRAWLRSELARWNQLFPVSASGIQVSAAGASPTSPDLGDAFGSTFRDGPGRDVPGPLRASFPKRSPKRIPGADGKTDNDVTPMNPIRYKTKP